LKRVGEKREGDGKEETEREMRRRWPAQVFGERKFG
jgi:hypothetical protein